ncbi:ATP-binding protein [Microbacterium sp. SSW1-59]|uniref:ATP-binding protein n=1 Tax=Microbacterium xanthum TaxID=3079794 RepID=UPI002AD41535|nr:ATP-binding protein [Microbacterium sp. SSW1-59]MDZ8201171.1 ATP-binding protein [Microbacterium sp. SSW1-59]
MTPDERPPRSRPDRTPIWLWILGPVGILALALIGVSFSVPGIELAVWWPAAGFAAWFALRAAPRHRWIAVLAIFIVTTTANALPGRDLLLCAAYGLANALEAAVIVTLLARRTRLFARRAHLITRAGRGFVLDTANNALYFVLAAALGCVASAVVIGAAGAVFSTGFTPLTGLFVAASHCAAVLLIAPFALLPPPLATRIHAIEVTAQTLLLVGMIVITFSPLTNLPGAFLIFGLFTWAVLRFPIRIVYPQALATAVAVLVLTVLGQGAFADRSSTPLETAAVTVIFMTSLAVFSVLLTSARYETLANATAALELTRVQAAAERERAAALSERLELERQRQDFVATTSHELRTPITSILGYSELLQESEFPPPERDWVEVIHRNAARLGDLVEDLLSLGHGDAEPAALTPVELAAADLASDVVSTHDPLAMTRQVDLGHRIASDAVFVADRSDAVRALGNLVSNAVKFTPQGGTVLVEAERDGGFVVFTVTDTGPGMSPATLARAFDRFYRAPDAETQNTPGTGLGLAIVRELAERNGGSVTIDSPRHGGLRSRLVFRAAPPPVVP